MKRTLLPVAVSALLWCAGCTLALGQSMQQPGEGHMPMGGMEHRMQPPVPTGPLKVSFGGKSAEFTPAAFAALPHTTLTVFNSHAKKNETYTGVAVMELLAKVGVPDKPHGKDLRLYLVAEGSDGYEAVYSVAEINPDVHDGAAMVADTVDGMPLTGGPQLVAAGEKRPARWVRALVAIRVMAAE